MEGRQDFLDSILDINSKYDVEALGRAYDVARSMHEGQLRKSGEPYLIHPIAVAKILAELGMDEDTLIAGLLHDVVEDTEYTKEELTEAFGQDVAQLVDGVTKLGSIVFENKAAQQAENLRKMFLAMSKDIRVLIIKLADRLHNLRTINYMTQSKIKEKCNETLDIYAPLASRLGIYSIKFELEDIALKYLYPEAYADLTQKIKEKKEQREAELNEVIQELNDILGDMDIHYEIYGRTKHFYSIYRKMKYQHKELDEIFDLMAVRIIVDTVKDCYSVLGTVHTMWTPIPGRFKDYVAMPKPNMYQSLHTTVMGDNGNPFEIQIRTMEMHHIAEYGIAAHWKYKEGKNDTGKEEVKLAWLRQSLEWQKDLEDPTEFLETLKVDLFENQVFVFTPKGDVIELPAGAIPLDFAFKIHTDVGAKCVGAKVNGKMVPIDHKLENGDIIEIVTSANATGPSIDWLNMAKSSTARTKIRQWLKKENKGDEIEKGRVMMDKHIRKKGYDPKEVLRNVYLTRIAKENGLKTIDELYNQIGNGGLQLGKTAAKILDMHLEEKEKEQKKEENTAEALGLRENAFKGRKSPGKDSKGVIIEGMEGFLVRMSKCCNPVPGDDIIGYITKGRGVSVHRKDCTNITSLPEDEKGRLIDVHWDVEKGRHYDVDIAIIAEDRKGLFSDLSKVCENLDANIVGVQAKASKGEDASANIVLTLSISDTAQMGKLIKGLKMQAGVYGVYRI